MSDEERKVYESIVHGLRSAGWTRLEAETEALDRVIFRRDQMEALLSKSPTKDKSE